MLVEDPEVAYRPHREELIGCRFVHLSSDSAAGSTTRAN
jgi:hypothetical protein